MEVCCISADVYTSCFCFAFFVAYFVSRLLPKATRSSPSSAASCTGEEGRCVSGNVPVVVVRESTHGG